MCFTRVTYTLQVRGADKISELANHVIVCGAEESFHNFIEQLRRCDPMRPPIVILHPKLPGSWSLLQTMFQPLHYVQVLTACLCCCFPSFDCLCILFFIHFSFMHACIHLSIHSALCSCIHLPIHLSDEVMTVRLVSAYLVNMQNDKQVSEYFFAMKLASHQPCDQGCLIYLSVEQVSDQVVIVFLC